MVRAQHQFGAPKHLPIPLVGQADADNFFPRSSSIGIGFALSRICQFINPMLQRLGRLCVKFIQLLAYQLFSWKRTGNLNSRQTRAG